MRDFDEAVFERARRNRLGDDGESFLGNGGDAPHAALHTGALSGITRARVTGARR